MAHNFIYDVVVRTLYCLQQNGNRAAKSEHSSMTFMTPDSELPLRRSSSANNVDGFMDDAGVITRGRPCSTPVRYLIFLYNLVAHFAHLST